MIFFLFSLYRCLVPVGRGVAAFNLSPPVRETVKVKPLHVTG